MPSYRVVPVGLKRNLLAILASPILTLITCVGGAPIEIMKSVACALAVAVGFLASPLVLLSIAGRQAQPCRVAVL